nr:PREDICTED: uncharacterized protein LOC109042384 [Bemisia tabaci]
MPATCCAVQCSHNAKNCKLKRFPVNEVRAKVWEQMLRRKNFTRKSFHRICACHFPKSQYDDINESRLRPDAVPLVFPTHTINQCESLDEPTLDKYLVKETREVQHEEIGEAELCSILTAINEEVQVSGGEQQALVLDINSIEECFEAEAGMVLDDVNEEVIFNYGTEDTIFDDETEEMIVDNGAEEIIVDDGAEEIIVDNGTEQIIVDNATEETSSPDGAIRVSVGPEHMNVCASADHLNGLTVDQLSERIEQLEREKSTVTRENYRLKTEITRLKATTSNFNQDEIQRLAGKKVSKWSKETVKKCLQVRFACGKTGYEFLRSQGYPLMAYSTLCERVQKLPLKCGISSKIIFLLKQKAATMKKSERQCFLSIDEMEITERIDYDQGQKENIGYATLGDKSKVACKLLLLVARGITTKWKQVIGWHLTTAAAPPPSEVWNFVLEGIKSIEGADYYAHGQVNDMGSSNRAVWKEAGIITAGRRKEKKIGKKKKRDKANQETSSKGSEQQQQSNNQENQTRKPENQKNGKYVSEKFSIPHPTRPNDEFYFFADAAHLLKNLKTGFLKHDFNLPPELLRKFNLPNAPVSHKWLYEFIDVRSEEESVFQLAPYLTTDLLSPSHYEKMRVGLATSIFSLEVAAALETAVIRNLISEEARTTIWFIKKISEWYGIMSSRRFQDSINRKNFPHKKRIISHVSDIFRGLRTSDNKWKPFQAGIILTNFSFLSLSEKLLFTRQIDCFLGSRTLQDGVENIFSVIRCKGSICPSALQALRAVRLLCFSQFTKDVKKSNYANDGDKHHLDILKSPIKRNKQALKRRSLLDDDLKAKRAKVPGEVKSGDEEKKSKKQLQFQGTVNIASDSNKETTNEEEVIYKELSKELNFPVHPPSETLEPLEEQALSDAVGHMISRLKKFACSNCPYFRGDLPLHESIYTACRDKGGLHYTPMPLFVVGQKLEIICRREMKTLTKFSLNIMDHIIQECISSCGEPLCDCRFFREFCHKFIRSRFNSERELSNNQGRLNSLCQE